MEQVKVCEIDGLEMKFHASGISGPNAKTPGKPYSAFWSCPSGDRSHSVTATYTPKIAEISQQIRETIGSAQTRARDFDAENRGKVRSGIVTSIIKHEGLQGLRGNGYIINEVTEFIMDGDAEILQHILPEPEMSGLDETVDQDALDEIFPS